MSLYRSPMLSKFNPELSSGQASSKIKKVNSAEKQYNTQVHHQIPNETVPLSRGISQTTALSQFQQQYDEMRKKYEKMQKQLDQVRLEKRKLQITLLNAHPEYYDKQIKRLRNELEKSQQDNEQNRYLYIKAENQRKQLEASLKIKTQGQKKYMKSYQTLKISNTQFKYQVQQKQRVFNRIREQLEKSNAFMSKKLEQTHQKCNNQENKLKSLNAQYDSLRNRYEKLQKKNNQLEASHKKYQHNTDEKIYQLTHKLQKQQLQYSKLKNQSRSTYETLAEQIQKYKSERASVQLLTAKKNENATIIKQNRLLELQVVRSEEKIKQLEFDLQKKNEMIKYLEHNVQELSQGKQVDELNEKIRQLQDQKNELRKYYQRINADLQREMQSQRIQNMNSSYQQHLYSNRSSSSANFQQILRIQLQENSNLKKQLAAKIHEIFNLKSDLEQLHVEKSNMKSELDVLEKKRKAEQKNSKIQQDIYGQSIKNQLETFKRKVQVLQTKLSYKAKEVKEKDNFIISSIVGRSRQEDVPIILADLQRIFQANYIDKLVEANQRIDELMLLRK